MTSDATTKISRTEGQDKRLQWWNDVLYNSMVPLYNSLDWMTCGAWWALQRRALEHIEGSRILEVGFGPGRLFCEISKTCNDVVQLDGIDSAEGMCQFTRRRLEKEGLRGTVLRGSVYDLPYSNDTFDTVVTTFSFSGFRDGKLAMKEMARVASGRLVIVDIGLPLDHNRIGSFWARIWEWCGDFLYDIPEMMEDAGLKVVVFEEYGPGQHIRVVVGEKLREGTAQPTS